MRVWMWLLLVGCAGETDPEPVEDTDDTDGDVFVPPELPDWGTLVRTLALPPGDPDCPTGGVRIDVGVDDGSRDSVPGDGVLQDGEVRSSKVVCNGGASEGLPTEPGGDAGTRLLDLSGGDGAFGGHGGRVHGTIASSGNGEVALYTTGAADASWAAPAAGAVQGVVVTTDQTVTALDLSAPAVGDLALDGGRLVQWNGSAAVEVTGLQVDAGATLTLVPTTPEPVVVDGDVAIAGTLEVRGALTLRARSLVASGQMTATESLGLVLDGSAAGTVLGSAHLSGDLVAPTVTVEARQAVYLAGTWRGRALTVESDGVLWVDATLDGSGAPGADGGEVVLSGADVRLEGVVSLGGGDADAQCVRCDGGAGGRLALSGASVVLRASLEAGGGEAIAQGTGGAGGTLSLSARDTAAVIVVDADVVLAGGHSLATAGDGGEVDLDLVSEAPAVLQWLGVPELGLHGGAGDEMGGDGGEVALVADVPVSLFPAVLAPGGGGPLGGDGGRVEVTVAEGLVGRRAVSTQGLLDLRGAASSRLGGDGGVVRLSAADAVTRSGEIRAAGGDASGVDGARGGDGQSVHLAGGVVVSTGSVASRGGHAYAAGDGGHGGDIAITGDTVQHDGELDARGGDGVARGGDGADVVLASVLPPTSNAAAAVRVEGGDGATSGVDGTFLVDGFPQ
jgi:hypothetical protein